MCPITSDQGHKSARGHACLAHSPLRLPFTLHSFTAPILIDAAGPPASLHQTVKNCAQNIVKNLVPRALYRHIWPPGGSLSVAACPLCVQCSLRQLLLDGSAATECWELRSLRTIRRWPLARPSPLHRCRQHLRRHQSCHTTSKGCTFQEVQERMLD